MIITNIELLKRLLSTAQAAYASLGSGVNLKKDLMVDIGGFTEEGAQEFVSRYKLVDQQPNTSTGFSATLFYDKLESKYVFAIRGTEIPSDVKNDLAVSDLGDIRTYGFAAQQAADMYRYWKKLTSPAGQAVSYSQQELLELYFLANPVTFLSFVPKIALGLSSVWGAVLNLADFLLFKKSLENDIGLNKLSPVEKVDITGHSLGGNLSYVFASMFPNNVNQVVTDNAPGVRKDGEWLLSLLGFSKIDESKITSVDAEGDTIHLLSITQQGGVVNISQEVGSTPIISGLANNHSVVNTVDSLNVMNLFAKLDPSQADKPSGILRDIMRASSNISDDTFENMLDALRYMMLGETIEKTKVSTKGDLDLRGKLYQNMHDLENATQFKDLIGKVTLVKTSTNPETAKSNYGQFLAIYYHSPVALNGTEANLKSINPDLYALWLSDKNLSSTDKSLGKQNFSDAWYQDRAEFLERLIVRNTDDSAEDANNPRRHMVYFTDVGANIKFFSFPTLSTMANTQAFSSTPHINIVFGSAQGDTLIGSQNNEYQDHLYGGAGNDVLYGKAGFDYLEGNADNDKLYGGDDADSLLGGAGIDSLYGEAGNDILEGGTGVDKYYFLGSNFGNDIIKNDTDGELCFGADEASATKLTTLIQSAPGSNIYYDDIKNPTKRAILLNEGDTQSLVISTVTTTGQTITPSGNSVTIKNWAGSNFGVELKNATTETPTNVGTVNGNADNNYININIYRESVGDSSTAVRNLNATGGAGKSYNYHILLAA